ALARTMRRLHADRAVIVEVAVDPAHQVRASQEDLEEMLGNLLDNACKWARSRVRVASSPAGVGRVALLVEDGGSGIAPTRREGVLRRGVRADEAAPGSGLGLAIVSELAEMYGGTISLDVSSSGGVRATLTLPA